MRHLLRYTALPRLCTDDTFRPRSRHESPCCDLRRLKQSFQTLDVSVEVNADCCQAPRSRICHPMLTRTHAAAERFVLSTMYLRRPCLLTAVAFDVVGSR